jgi:hypothetical protein
MFEMCLALPPNGYFGSRADCGGAPVRGPYFPPWPRGATGSSTTISAYLLWKTRNLAINYYCANTPEQMRRQMRPKMRIADNMRNKCVGPKPELRKKQQLRNKCGTLENCETHADKLRKTCGNIAEQMRKTQIIAEKCRTHALGRNQNCGKQTEQLRTNWELWNKYGQIAETFRNIAEKIRKPWQLWKN